MNNGKPSYEEGGDLGRGRPYGCHRQRLGVIFVQWAAGVQEAQAAISGRCTGKRGGTEVEVFLRLPLWANGAERGATRFGSLAANLPPPPWTLRY